MRVAIVAAFVLGFLLLLFVLPAHSQALCGIRDDIVSRLESGYQETPKAVGLAGNGAIVELVTSPEGTWTLLMTQPNGMSCLMAAGENWTEVSRGEGT